MEFKDIELMFNRALARLFGKRKLTLTVALMIACGFLVVFCRGLALSFGWWGGTSLGFLAFFSCSALMLFLGVLLIRVYRQERDDEAIEYARLLRHSRELLTGISYLAAPTMVAFLCMWIVFGLFNLVHAIPAIGGLIGAIFAFAPFLITLSALILCVINLFLLFMVAPAVSTGPGKRRRLTRLLIGRFLTNPFANLLLALVAILPLAAIVGLEVLAIRLASAGISPAATSGEVVLTWFFVMLPFNVITAPALIFFFNFAAEAHALLTRKPIPQENHL